MPPTTLSSGAKKAANAGPVFITDRGKPGHVLLSIAEYHRLMGMQPRIADLLAMPGAEAIEFDIPQSEDLAMAADFS